MVNVTLGKYYLKKGSHSCAQIHIYTQRLYDHLSFLKIFLMVCSGSRLFFHGQCIYVTKHNGKKNFKTLLTAVNCGPMLHWGGLGTRSAVNCNNVYTKLIILIAAGMLRMCIVAG